MCKLGQDGFMTIILQWQLLLTSKYDRTIQAIWFRFRLHLNRNNYGNENTIDTYESIRTICNSEINFFVLLFTVKSKFGSTCESCRYIPDPPRNQYRLSSPTSWESRFENCAGQRGMLWHEQGNMTGSLSFCVDLWTDTSDKLSINDY